MIISASRRTDIPAFYAEWFMRRVRDGYCCVANPCNSRQVTRVSLYPAEVDVVVFWTRNPAPLLPRLDELDARGYRYYFQYTLTGYPRLFERHTPPLENAIATFHQCAERVGAERMIWRYDPIVLTNHTDYAYHVERFAAIARALQGNSRRVVVSLMDEYRGARERLARLAEHGVTPLPYSVDDAEFGAFMRALAACAQAHGFEIVSCAEPLDLRPYGISPGKCIDDGYIRRVFGLDVTQVKDKMQRAACGCVASKDIGAYDSCLHACVYCYATRGETLAAKNHARHDVASSSLLRE